MRQLYLALQAQHLLELEERESYSRVTYNVTNLGCDEIRTISLGAFATEYLAFGEIISRHCFVSLEVLLRSFVVSESGVRCAASPIFCGAKNGATQQPQGYS